MSRSVSSNRLSEPLDRGSMGHSPAREIVQLAVPQQQLDDSQILGAAVDQRRLGPPHRVRTVRGWIKPDGLHPPTNDSCILASGQVRGLAQAAGEEVIVWPPLSAANATRQ
jgi:hypothetical protein